MTDVTWLQTEASQPYQGPTQLLEIYQIYCIVSYRCISWSSFKANVFFHGFGGVLFRSGKANGDGGEKENGDGGDGGDSGWRTL